MHQTPIVMLGSFRLDLSVVLMLAVTCTIVFVFARIATRNLSVHRPGKLQNFMEWLVELVVNMISGTMDMRKGRKFVSLAVAMIMFIFVGNMLGLPFGVVTEYTSAHQANIFGKPLASVIEAFHHSGTSVEHAHVEVQWWKSPTADLSVTLGLALIVFVISHGLGLLYNTKAYLKHYVQPFFVFFPINIIETLSKTLTHGIRLFANIFAGELLLSTILKLTALKWIGFFAAIPVLIMWQGFSVFIGGIQAFVFTILMLVYISQNLEAH